MKKHTLSLVMVATVLLISLLDVFAPIRVFSAFENRFLTLKPTISVESIFSNKYTSTYEKYVNDQFIGRDYWITLKSIFEKMTNKKENNGIYFGGEYFLFEKIVDVSSQLSKNEKTMEEFLQKYSDLPLSLFIPLSSSVTYKAFVPDHAPLFDQTAWYNSHAQSWPLIDNQLLLEMSDLQTFYKNDHHWTLYGAYLGYLAIASEFGFEPKQWQSFEIKSIANFLGTFYARGKPLTYKADVLQYYNPPIFSYEASGKIYDSLIDESQFNEYDKYGAFLYGNHGFATIKVRDVKKPKRLLLIKDSYANSLVPFLVNHYDEIELVDLRYFSGSLNAIIKSKIYDNILFLNSFSQFSNDSNIAKLRY